MIEALNKTLSERIQACEARRRRLQADERHDEAVFAQVQENVYALFQTVLSTAQATQGAQAEAFFRDRLDRIPDAWRKSLERAIAHSETDKIQIEIMKLEAVTDIKAIMKRIQEDGND